MKIRTIISALFLIIVTVLYYFGICEWDIWVYLLCVAVTLVAMLIFMKQEKKYNRLIESKENK